MLSVFDMLKIGIGPSSSHTVGPMVAARQFAEQVLKGGKVARVVTDLYGSLALTGKGHGTVGAILNGLEGKLPKTVDPATMIPRAQALMGNADLNLGGEYDISFDFARDVQLHMHQFLPLHPNGLRFRAFDAEGQLLQQETYYSVGGGFIVTEANFSLPAAEKKPAPYPFNNAAELMAQCQAANLSIAELVMANECVWRSKADVVAGLLEIAAVMQTCVSNGCTSLLEELPGDYHIRRRAPAIYRKMTDLDLTARPDFMLWPLVFAMAVSEENAAGGRVVTAPTNGAAGIMPAVLQFYRNFTPTASDAGIVEFLLTASAIGMLYKLNASISGAEVGCQGEVGVACSMAAAAYCAVLGGTLAQIENAAEIGMEHHLGLTCDPVGGLVQIPCIERNGVAAEKAIKIAQLALLEDGQHIVSLDKVIETMYRTGMDMKNIYKETSLGGLALTVGVPAC